MAFEIPGFSWTRKANTDLSSSQFRALKLVNDGVELCDNDNPIGVLQNKPQASEGATVVSSGVTFAVAGNTVTAGSKLKVDSQGRFVPLSGAETKFHAYALENASANQTFAVFLCLNAAV